MSKRKRLIILLTVLSVFMVLYVRRESKTFILFDHPVTYFIHKRSPNGHYMAIVGSNNIGEHYLIIKDIYHGDQIVFRGEIPSKYEEMGSSKILAFQWQPDNKKFAIGISGLADYVVVYNITTNALELIDISSGEPVPIWTNFKVVSGKLFSDVEPQSETIVP